MDNDRDRDEIDRAIPELDHDDIRGVGDDDFDESDDAGGETDDEAGADDERLTGEVGSEGGSPGETVGTRRGTGAGAVGGSEATETWSPEQSRSENVERVGESAQPSKRNP